MCYGKVYGFLPLHVALPVLQYSEVTHIRVLLNLLAALSYQLAIRVVSTEATHQAT